jgi:hypothetical protein
MTNWIITINFSDLKNKTMIKSFKMCGFPHTLNTYYHHFHPLIGKHISIKVIFIHFIVESLTRYLQRCHGVFNTAMIKL